MTLNVALKCRDGYVIASDTANIYGSTSYQDRKIDCHHGGDQEGKYRIVIAQSGYMNFAKMASERIKDEVAAMDNDRRTVGSMKSKIQDVVYDVYERHVCKLYSDRSEGSPDFAIVGAIHCRQQFLVFRSDLSSVSEVDTFACSGTGEEIAVFLCEQLFVSRQHMLVNVSTAAAVHLLKHVFTAAKRSCDAVGGHTEMIAHADGIFKADFFELQGDRAGETTIDRSEYLWGIHAMVGALLRNTLAQGSDDTLAEHLRCIERRAQAIKAQILPIGGVKQPRTIHRTELDTGLWDTNFFDHDE